MATHELDLLENAIDSFNEALRQYQLGVDGNHASYKFAILHFAHFVELIFKYHVTQSHPLLIYKNPFKKDVHNQNTIGMWEAVQFLRNEGKEISKDFSNDLEWLKKLRNNIEHHKFDMEVDEVRDTIGRITRALFEFNEYFDDFDIKENVEAENLEVFEGLLDEYKAKIAAAHNKAEEESEDGMSHMCYDCFNDTAALDQNAYLCHFCDFLDNLIDCSVCGDIYRETDTSMWNEEGGSVICYGCLERIENM